MKPEIKEFIDIGNNILSQLESIFFSSDRMPYTHIGHRVYKYLQMDKSELSLRLMHWGGLTYDHKCHLIIFKRNNPILELDLFFIIKENEKYSAYIKARKDQPELVNYFGTAVKVPKWHNNQIVGLKRLIKSGINGVKTGHLVASKVTKEELIASFTNFLSYYLLEKKEILRHSGDIDNRLGEFGIKNLARVGQKKLKRDLLSIHGVKCMISGCNVEKVLDAAHIIDYSVSFNCCFQNGLLLKTDIHRLYDSSLLKIHPDTLKVEISNDLLESEYEKYNGIKIEFNPNFPPPRKRLAWKYYQ